MGRHLFASDRQEGIAMGLLIKGKWVDQWYDTESSKGEFIRSQSQFRNWVTTDGRAGPTGEDGFRAEPGRHHLYVSLACPWAHRTLIFRVLKGLEKMISVSVVNPLMAEHGWTFKPDDGVVPDPIHQAEDLHQDRKSTRLNSSHGRISYAVFCLKKKRNKQKKSLIGMYHCSASIKITHR